MSFDSDQILSYIIIADRPSCLAPEVVVLADGMESYGGAHRAVARTVCLLAAKQG